MNNRKATDDAFKQAVSYAKLLESSVVILCDKERLLVYKRTDSFDRQDYEQFFWKEMGDPDKFQKIKNLIVLS